MATSKHHTRCLALWTCPKPPESITFQSVRLESSISAGSGWLESAIAHWGRKIIMTVNPFWPKMFVSKEFFFFFFVKKQVRILKTLDFVLTCKSVSWIRSIQKNNSVTILMVPVRVPIWLPWSVLQVGIVNLWARWLIDTCSSKWGSNCITLRVCLCLGPLNQTMLQSLMELYLLWVGHVSR